MPHQSNAVKGDDSDLSNPEVKRFLGHVEAAMSVRHWNRAKLADQLGVNRSTVTEWFTKGRVPTGDVVLRLPGLLGVSAEELFGGGGGGDGGGTDGPGGDDLDAREVFQQLRTIIEESDTPPAYKVLMIDAVGGVLSRATLYRGEVTAGFRAVALQEAERTDRERQQTIRHVEESAHVRALELRRDQRTTGADPSPYGPPPEPKEGERKVSGD